MVKAKARYGYKGIVVDDCPFCHRSHRHNHPVGEGVRMAECFGGEYLLDFEAAQQSAQADEFTCLACGKSLATYWSFCPQCGQAQVTHVRQNTPYKTGV